MYGLVKVPVVHCKTDSKSLEEHLQSSKAMQDLRLRVDVARLREMVKFSEITVQWVDKHKQLADPMTKRGASAVRLLEVLHAGSLRSLNE